jgi:hypothetical protein
MESDGYQSAIYGGYERISQLQDFKRFTFAATL